MWILICIVCGVWAFLGGVIGYIREQDRRPVWAVVGALIGLAVSAMLIGGVGASIKHDRNEYNDGLCTICGEGEYHLADVSHAYYYECNKCGHVIKTSSIMK